MEPTVLAAIITGLAIVGAAVITAVVALRQSREGRAPGRRPPTVTWTNPQDRAADVPPDIHRTAAFSKDMDRTTINATTFKLLDQHNLQPVNGDVHYDVRTKVATFTPSAPLKNGRTYAATITASVKDKAGNAMAQDRTWHFTVKDQGE